MEENNGIPLSVAMENTKAKLNQAFRQTISESKLPAYLIEGMVLEMLSEIRNHKNLELLSDINAMQNKDKNKGG